MVVISRKVGEVIVIDGTITLSVVDVRGDKVRLGVAAPMHVPVHREEVYQAFHGPRREPPMVPRPAEEQAFVDAILEAPDDEGIRLIFADWLDECGNPYGEFIRVQCRAACLPVEDPEREELEDRAWDLCSLHGADWRSHLPPVLRRATFTRGFVESAELTVTEFLEHAATILTATPLRRLRIPASWPVGPLAALLGSPYLARLVELDLSGLGFRCEEAIALAWSPHVAGLRVLDLRDNGIGDSGAEALAVSHHLEGLERLDLSQNPLGQTGTRRVRERFGERVLL